MDPMFKQFQIRFTILVYILQSICLSLQSIYIITIHICHKSFPMLVQLLLPQGAPLY